MSGGARNVGMMAEKLGLPGLQPCPEEEQRGDGTEVLKESPDSHVDPPLLSPLDYPSKKGITDGQQDESSQLDSLGLTSESERRCHSDHAQDGSAPLPQGVFEEDQHCNSLESREDPEAQGQASEGLLVSSSQVSAGEEEQGTSSPETCTLMEGGLEKSTDGPTTPGTMDRDSGLRGIETPDGLDYTSDVTGQMNGDRRMSGATGEEDLTPESSPITLELSDNAAPVDTNLLLPSLDSPGGESAGVDQVKDLGGEELAVEYEDDLKELTDSASTDHTLEDSGDFSGISTVVGGVTSEASPPTSPTQREEDVTAESWRTKRRHVFVLSEAGKPIYSRYGNEEALSSTMGVMMALVSFVQSGNNSIRSIHSENQKVVFLQQGPLVLVSVSQAPQSEEQLRQELQYVYYQIISMLTQASVARIFERKKNYDLRRLLAGSEKILDSLLDLLDTDPGFLLCAVRCVALPSTLRDSLSSILTKAITPNLVFSILVAQHQLVTVVQERAVIEDCRLDPADLHLLLNLIGASSAFQAGEIWTPICLPCFNPDGYFYAYISYLDPECTVCLVLLSTDKESFYAVSGCKRKIQETMEAQNSLQALAGALRYCPYSVSLVGVPELLHFVYKPLDIPEPYQQLPQFTSPEPDGPYSSEEEKQRLFDLYRYLHCRIHSSARPLRLIYHVADKETLLAWVTSKFELYTAFSSLVTKVGAINVITKLLRWIKREEDRLFIRYPPKYSTTPLPGKGGKASRTDRTDPSQNGFFTGL